jgi:hypothetical protein
MLAAFALSLDIAVSSSGNHGFVAFLVMVGMFSVLSSLLSAHVVQQFADSRARLMPGFGRAHATIAAVAALAIGVLLPAMFTWIAGYRSVGLVAVAMVLLGTIFWQNLSQAAWIQRLLGVAWGAAIISAVEKDAVQRFVLGQSELMAMGLLAFGIVITLLGAVRLLRLNEDMPTYRRVVQWLRKAASETTGETSTDESERPSRLSEWVADRQMASLTRHARQASVSRWSQICRWQVGMISGWQVWPWILVMVPLFLLRAGFDKAQLVLVLLLLVLLPATVNLFTLAPRTHAMRHELCMPVARKTYLWQLGAAAALSHLQLWLRISAAAVLCWVLAAGWRPAYADIARVLAFAGLFQVWFFGVGVWWAAPYYFCSMLGAVTRIIIIVTHFLIPFAWIPLEETGWQSFQLPVAVLFAIFGVLLTYDAYRRWLVADVD